MKFSAILLGSTAVAMMAEGGALAEIEGNLPTLKQFDENAPAEFGNQYMEALLKSSAVDEQIAALTNAAENVKRYIGFELTKAVMNAAEKGKDINLYKIFEGAKETEKLFSKLLQFFGVIKKEIVDEDVVTTWSSPDLQKEFDYSSLDKEKDENEYTRRFNNRKRLNMQLSQAIKTAVALVDNKVSSQQLKLTENSTTKEVEPVIENAPDILRGDKAKNGPTITFGKRTPNEGSEVAPNIASLVRQAEKAHKKADDKTGTGDRADKGNDRSGDAKLGMSDEDFGGLVNNLRRAIMAQEGNLSEEMQKQLRALVPFIDQELTKAAQPKESLEDLPDDEETETSDDTEEGTTTTA